MQGNGTPAKQPSLEPFEKSGGSLITEKRFAFACKALFSAPNERMYILKHNKYFKTQLAALVACSVGTIMSRYNSLPFRDLSPRGDFKSFVIACQKRQHHK